MVVYDCVVVGAGVEGSAAAYNLAQQGKRVLLIEKFNLPHTRGSSHGATRSIHVAQPKLIYAQMVKEAFKMWKDIEQQSGTEILKNTGKLLVSLRGVDGGKVGPLVKQLEKVQSDHHTLDSARLKQDFPMVSFSADHWAVYEPDAGVLLADKAVAALQELFLQHGGVLRDGEQVLSVTPGHTVTITTDKTIYQTSSLILAAGPWTSKLLEPLGLNLPLKPVKISVCYWRQKQANTYNLKTLPTIAELKGNERYYCFPSFEYGSLVKVGYHNGPEIEPDHRDEETEEDKNVIAKISDFIRNHLPGIKADKPSIVEPCIYTWTPDQDFILDQHPKWKNIIIAAGFSGHGFKHAPVIGKLLGELALDKQTSFDISDFHISRFGTMFNKSKF